MLGINRAYGKNSLSKNLLKMVSEINLFASNTKMHCCHDLENDFFSLFLLSPLYFGLVFKSCGCIEIR